MKPTSLKQYLAKSIIVRQHARDEELRNLRQENKELRSELKRAFCYICEDGICPNEVATCEHCDNTMCSFERHNDIVWSCCGTFICEDCINNYCSQCGKETTALYQCQICAEKCKVCESCIYTENGVKYCSQYCYGKEN